MGLFATSSTYSILSERNDIVYRSTIPLLTGAAPENVYRLGTAGQPLRKQVIIIVLNPARINPHLPFIHPLPAHRPRASYQPAVMTPEHLSRPSHLFVLPRPIYTRPAQGDRPLFWFSFCLFGFWPLEDFPGRSNPESQGSANLTHDDALFHHLLIWYGPLGSLVGRHPQ